MLCVATFRWLCHFAESGYLIFQVPATPLLRQPYKILSDSLVCLYPPRFLLIRIFVIRMYFNTFTMKSVYEVLPGPISPECWILRIRMGELYL